MNLLPPRMKLRIYADMPWSVRLRAVAAPFKGQHPKELIEPRVGDEDMLPYDMLYRQMLDLVRSAGCATSSAPQYHDWQTCAFCQDSSPIIHELTQPGFALSLHSYRPMCLWPGPLNDLPAADEQSRQHVLRCMAMS